MGSKRYNDELSCATDPISWAVFRGTMTRFLSPRPVRAATARMICYAVLCATIDACDKKWRKELETLFRPKSSLVMNPKKVLVIGNGAVISGWAPMVMAVKKSKLFEHYGSMDDTTIRKFVDLLPAQIVHEYNLIRGVVVSRFGKDIASADVKVIKNFLVNFFDFIQRIAIEYDTVFPFRIELGQVLSMVDADTGIMTLNYDNSLWEYSSGGSVLFANLLHLHGRAVEPESLYFPTDNTVLDEIANLLQLLAEDTRRKALFDEITGILKSKLGDATGLLQRRSPDMRDQLNAVHETAIDWVSGCEELIFWGVGMNPYDAEFLTILNRATGAVRVERSLTVINICEETGEKTRAYLHVEQNDYSFVKAKMT